MCFDTSYHCLKTPEHLRCLSLFFCHLSIFISALGTLKKEKKTFIAFEMCVCVRKSNHRDVCFPFSYYFIYHCYMYQMLRVGDFAHPLNVSVAVKVGWLNHWLVVGRGHDLLGWLVGL